MQGVRMTLNVYAQVHHDPHPIVSSTAVYYKVGPRGAPQ
jgi:hypothetical protein